MGQHDSPWNRQLLTTLSTHSIFHCSVFPVRMEKKNLLPEHSCLPHAAHYGTSKAECSSKSHWDLLGNYTWELIHLKVFMTGHFKWPCSRLFIHFPPSFNPSFFHSWCWWRLLCCANLYTLTSICFIIWALQNELVLKTFEKLLFS